MSEKITDAELLKAVLWDDREGYETVDERMIEQTRWAILMECIFIRRSDDRLFMMTWRKAATETQEHEYPDEAVECEAYPEKVTRYREVE